MGAGAGLRDMYWARGSNDLVVGVAHSEGGLFYSYGKVTNLSLKTFTQPTSFPWFKAVLLKPGDIAFREFPLEKVNPPNEILTSNPLVKTGREVFSLGQIDLQRLFKGAPAGEYHLQFSFYLYQNSFRTKKSWNPFLGTKTIFSLVCLPTLRIPVTVQTNGMVLVPNPRL